MEALNRVLYIDLSKKRFWVEDRSDLFQRWLGGVGVGVKLLQEEVDVNVDPLGPENTIIFCVGPFNAAYPMGSKVVALFKSPLTGNLGESYAGGRAGTALRLAGYGAMVIRGRSDYPMYIAVHGGKVYFRDARGLWGMSSSITVGRVIAEREPMAGQRTIMRIGLAGEKLIPYACVVTETCRHFGRLGLGAVFGSKNLKAVVISGNMALPVRDKQAYREAYDRIFSLAVTSGLMRKYHELGTPMNVNPLNELGGLPTKNLKSGRFEHAEEMSGEALASKYLGRRLACTSCPVACIHLAALREEYPHEPYFYKTSFINYDYEPIYALGTMLGVETGRGVLQLIKVVEDYGLDAMSLGVTLAWATEAQEKELINLEGLRLRWGDVDSYIKAIRLIVEGHGVYSDLAKGVKHCAEKYGGEEFALHYGGLEMPGYHTGPMAHLGFLTGARHSHLDSAGYSLDQKLKELPTPGESVEKLTAEEGRRTVLNSLVVCLFSRGIYTFKLISEALKPLGINYTVEEIEKLGVEIYRERWRLKLKLGFRIEDLRIPGRVYETPAGPWGNIDKEYMKAAIGEFKEKIKSLV